MYAKSAEIYDCLYEDKFDYAASTDQLDQVVQGRNPQATCWLDVACGTGLHLNRLKDRYEVVGVDRSAEMLDVAARRLPGADLYRADMLSLDLGRTFDVVTCLFSSVGYMRNLADLNQAISAMARHLNPGGLLLIEPWIDPGKWMDGHLGADFIDQPDIKLARMTHDRREGRRTLFDMHHLVLTASGIDYFVESHELFMFTDDEYRGAFVEAGLPVELIEGGLAGRGLYVGEAKID